MLENKSIECEKAFEKLLKLDVASRYQVIAILLEHWNRELINDGNYLDGDEALENDREIFTPNDVEIPMIDLMAKTFLYSATILKNKSVNDLKHDDVEANIIVNPRMAKCITMFYTLSFEDKLDYLTEMFAGFENGTVADEDSAIVNISDNINGYEVASRIQNYKKSLNI